jgi:hypothetical protein
VALRAEVAAMRRAPGAALDPAAPAGELTDDQPSHDTPCRSDQGGMTGVLRRIDAVTAAAVDAAPSAARRSSPADAERSGRS